MGFVRDGVVCTDTGCLGGGDRHVPMATHVVRHRVPTTVAVCRFDLVFAFVAVVHGEFDVQFYVFAA